jgi:hypothetical protein
MGTYPVETLFTRAGACTLMQTPKPKVGIVMALAFSTLRCSWNSCYVRQTCRPAITTTLQWSQMQQLKCLVSVVTFNPVCQHLANCCLLPLVAFFGDHRHTSRLDRGSDELGRINNRTFKTDFCCLATLRLDVMLCLWQFFSRSYYRLWTMNAYLICRSWTLYAALACVTKFDSASCLWQFVVFNLRKIVDGSDWSWLSIYEACYIVGIFDCKVWIICPNVELIWLFWLITQQDK